MKKIVAICGSTRANSTNLAFIKAFADLSKELFKVELFHGIADLPHFNPDLDTEEAPKKIAAFRDKLRGADGILICTPEYAMGVPGSLKNAIDWTVSSMEFSAKPTALITASSMGQMGHASLLETLRIIEAGISEETQLLVPYARIKINGACQITDKETLKGMTDLVAALHRMIISVPQRESLS